MNIKSSGGKDDPCLIFEGEMTYRFSRDIENRIIDSMRRHRHLKVDLSGVHEIDLCGIHLLGVLRSFGDDAIQIVATSPAVDAALSRLPASLRGSSLGRVARRGEPALSLRPKS